ncbi:MAG: hypothetical protein ACHBN1_14620 [Heteroscytonema crispum UTEX LB 1556]
MLDLVLSFILDDDRRLKSGDYVIVEGFSEQNKIHNCIGIQLCT